MGFFRSSNVVFWNVVDDALRFEERASKEYV